MSGLDYDPTYFGWVGHFDHPAQVNPFFDPGLDVNCPVCGERLHLRPRKTISLAPCDDESRVTGGKSYFFRAHKDCWDGLTEKEQATYEAVVIDQEGHDDNA